ncbi:MAG TPA: PAS domain-containing protein [Methanosarcina sp.]|nr:PAS domain-containing protein [Methanosarcina sp.]
MTAGKKTQCIREKQQEESLRTLMDRAAKTVAFALGADFCKIFRLSNNCSHLPENKPTIQEIGYAGQSDKLDELSGGVSVFVRSGGKTSMVMTLYRGGPDKFAPEEVRFLRYILSLVVKVQACKKVDAKLQDRMLFLESLLAKVPDPFYFKEMPQVVQDSSRFYTQKAPDFSNKKAAGYSMHKLDEVIPKELTALYKKKNKGTQRASEEFIRMPEALILRENEEALKIALEVQKVLWTVINNSPAVVFLWRNEEKWPADFVSENISQLGYEVEDFTSGRILYGDIVHKEDIKAVTDQLTRCIEDKCEGFKMEYRIFTKEGGLRWVDERTFIQRDSEGKAVYFQGVVIDITERKIAEEALEKAEQLRKKEINHRIKNNLQIVSSLLDLQAEKFSDKKVIEAFQESESRILSMSLIHEELYESGKLDVLNFLSYVRKLIADLCRSYNTESSSTRVNLKLEEVFLGADTAVSLGIIINELFTNSVKYAFPRGRGEINIELRREKTGKKADENKNQGKTQIKNSPYENNYTHEQFILIFSDNGIGFPEGLDVKNAESLGLQLVGALVSQIEGSLELKVDKGTRFKIEFMDNIRGRN